MKRVTMLAALIGMLLTAASRAEDPAPLVLEAKIPLGAVTGRIDHFAFDADRQLLFVAELGNDSVGIVDLKEPKVLRGLPALREPPHRARRRRRQHPDRFVAQPNRRRLQQGRPCGDRSGEPKEGS